MIDVRNYRNRHLHRHLNHLRVLRPVARRQFPAASPVFVLLSVRQQFPAAYRNAWVVLCASLVHQNLTLAIPLELLVFGDAKADLAKQLILLVRVEEISASFLASFELHDNIVEGLIDATAVVVLDVPYDLTFVVLLGTTADYFD